MTRIKICGITNLQDALAAVNLEVDALGFVFYSKSPRYTTPDRAEQIRRNIPPFTLCIGVFVDERKDKVIQTAEQCQLDGLQFHGNESPEYCSYFSAYKVIKAFPIKSRSELKVIERYNVQAILIDALDPINIGGTGKKADWELAREAKKFGSLVLAGGLNETNIQAAIRAVNPYAVDVSSSLETGPGVKDHDKMRRFVGKIREIDRLLMN
ncbi:MAG: phosphoribosylanthranilate isomerase [Deltaproteobacteria bacterium]|nr:phosphoribosylanthranilate isomerase [Deltaproteobacteria bacterium]